MCGIVGVFNHPEAARLTQLCLHMLQHRGTESTGIVTSHNNHLYSQVGLGHVEKFFTPDRLAQLPGMIAVGHTRYSTTGDSILSNAQPLVSAQGRVIAHNGNLINIAELRQRLISNGASFTSTSDTEIILHMMAQGNSHNMHEQLLEALRQVQGAYSLVVMNTHELIAVRDPQGFRPLALGQLNKTYLIASEPCAFDIVGASYVRDILPGEVIHITHDGLVSYFLPISEVKTPCVFEFIYFSRPDSKIFGRNVHDTRKAFGRQLALESPISADVVIPIPDSGIPAAIGYAEKSGIPFDTGLVRSHYSGRTFIEPEQHIRDFRVKLKFNPVRSVLSGKRVVVVDDSIVRGTTSRQLVHMIREAGAKEIHFRVSAPPVISPCFFGIDMPTRDELLGANNSLSKMREFLCADSLSFLSYAGMMEVIQQQSVCSGCFTGKYPLSIRA